MSLFNEIKSEFNVKAEVNSALDEIKKSKTKINEVTTIVNDIETNINSGKIEIAKNTLFERNYKFKSLSKLQNTIDNLKNTEVDINKEFKLIISSITLDKESYNLIEIIRIYEIIDSKNKFEKIKDFVDWVDKKVTIYCKETSILINDKVEHERNKKIQIENNKKAEELRNNQILKRKLYFNYFVVFTIVLITQLVTYALLKDLLFPWVTNRGFILIISSITSFIPFYIINVILEYLEEHGWLYSNGWSVEHSRMYARHFILIGLYLIYEIINSIN
jgi:hypothetical protein